jgi:hypothetical protein
MNKIIIGLFTFVTFVIRAKAHADGLPVAVVPPNGCPSQASVDAELARLLPMPPPSAYAVDIIVADRGDRFEVDIGGAQRSFVEPTRSCAERARTAAIVIAVTMAPPTMSYAETGEPEMAETATECRNGQAVLVARPSAVEAAPIVGRRHKANLLFAADISGAYGNIPSNSFGSGVLTLQLGAGFSDWTIAARGQLTVGYGGPGGTENGSSDTSYLIQGVLGVGSMLKLGDKLRLGLSIGGGIGSAELKIPAAARTSWSGQATLAGGWLLSVSSDLTVDLASNRAHTQTLYLLASVGVVEWLGISELFVDNPPRTATEFDVRLGLGYRFGR